MAVHGMHTSEVLKNDIFQAGPKPLELQIRMERMLSQFSPEGVESPEIQNALARIDELTRTIKNVAWEAREGLVDLYAETRSKIHLWNCQSQVAILESQHKARIAFLLGASNDEHFSQAA